MNTDPIIFLSGGDAAIAAAIKKAQATFPEFVRELELEARRVIPALDAAIVKAFFPNPNRPDEGEHLFIDDILVEQGTVHGTIASAPQMVSGLSEGQRVSFPIAHVSDWFIVTNGRGKGGHTLDIIAKGMGREAHKEAAGYPPFVWFA